MWLSSCKATLILYFFFCTVRGQEVSDVVFTGDLDPEAEATIERKRDTDITLPALSDVGTSLPMTLASSFSMNSVGSVTMKSTVDVVGQDGAGVLASLGVLFGNLAVNGDGFYRNSDVFYILYPFIMQLVNPTPRVIIQVQQLLIVQRIECCKSGEETCCGIIAEMMTTALINKYKEILERQEEREDSHRVFWRQLDSLLNMPVIAVAIETPEKEEMIFADKMVEDTGDSVKVTKRNKDGSLSKKTIYPKVPNHMLDENRREPVDASALEDGEASHVFMEHMIGEKSEDRKKTRKSWNNEGQDWAASVPRRSLMAIMEDNDEGEDEDKWMAKIPVRSLMVEKEEEEEEEEKREFKGCKYKSVIVAHSEEVRNENCFNCSCRDGRILCHSKFVCDTHQDMGDAMDKTVILVNKLLALGKVSQDDMQHYLSYRNQLLKHMQQAKVKEETTVEALEMILNGGNGPGGLPGPRLLPSLINQLQQLHDQRETQIKIFVGLVNSLQSVKRPLHDEL